MKRVILLFLFILGSIGYVNAGAMGDGDCSGFPAVIDSSGSLLLAGQRATSDYANDVKNCIYAVQVFLKNSPYFSHDIGTLGTISSSGTSTNMIAGKLGLGFTSLVENKLQVNGNMSCLGLIASSSTGQNYFAGFTVSTGVVSTGQLHSRIATGTAPLTVNSTTKIDNLNADMIEGYHITCGTSTLFTITTGVIADGTITFGITYTNPPVIMLTWQGISGDYYKQNVFIKEFASKTGATYSIYNADDGTVYGYVHWLAIGN